MTRKIEDLTPQEVLALAIRIEQANALRLRNFAFAFQNQDPEVSEKFEELAAEEDLHEKWLQTKYKKLFKGLLPSVEDFNLDGMREALEWDDSEYLVFDRLKADRIYHQALRAEQRAKIFYEHAAKSAEDRPLALLFEELAQMEQDHTGWLLKKIKERPANPVLKVLGRLIP